MAAPVTGRAEATAQVRRSGWQEHERLKATCEPGVVDWGANRRPEGRYEAYWRGMSIGLFPSAEAAWTFLRGLG
jgi:hypothetical protein